MNKQGPLKNWLEPAALKWDFDTKEKKTNLPKKKEKKIKRNTERKNRVGKRQEIDRLVSEGIIGETRVWQEKGSCRYSIKENRGKWWSKGGEKSETRTQQETESLCNLEKR